MKPTTSESTRRGPGRPANAEIALRELSQSPRDHSDIVLEQSAQKQSVTSSTDSPSLSSINSTSSSSPFSMDDSNKRGRYSNFNLELKLQAIEDAEKKSIRSAASNTELTAK